MRSQEARSPPVRGAMPLPIPAEAAGAIKKQLAEADRVWGEGDEGAHGREHDEGMAHLAQRRASPTRSPSGTPTR